MNSEATEPTSGFSPAVMRRSMPRRYASATATYCALENRSVTLIGTPAKIASSMAGEALLGTRNHDEEIGLSCASMKSLGRGEGAGRVVGQQG